MKRLPQIFQALLGVAALICSALVAVGRLAWRTIKVWWRDRPKRLCRGLAWTFAAAVAVAVVAWACAFYDEEFGRCDWGDRMLSGNITLHSFANDTYRVYNEVTGKYMTPRLDWVSDVPAGDSLAVFARGGRRGYLNVNTGESVVEARDYERAWVFSEGLAAVVKEGKVGFINVRNELVIPFRYDYSPHCKMNVSYLFHNGYCMMTDADGNCGLIDRSGEWVVEPTYDELWVPAKNGCRVVVDDGVFGVLDAECKVKFPVEYGYITIMDDGGFTLTKGGREWRIDSDGNVVNEFLFSCSNYMYYPTGYNDSGEVIYALADYMEYELLQHYGIMNRHTGKPVTPAIYDEINMISENLFEVQPSDSFSWHIIDSQGNIVTP